MDLHCRLFAPSLSPPRGIIKLFHWSVVKPYKRVHLAGELCQKLWLQKNSFSKNVMEVGVYASVFLEAQ